MTNNIKSVKRHNIILERDENIDSGYIYFPPFSHKNSPKITKHQIVETSQGIFTFDWSGDKIAGIEIENFSQKCHFSFPNSSLKEENDKKRNS
jgi:hypothetical protein